MLPTPTREELTRRLPRLVFGLVLFGFGTALMVMSNLGLAPWEVFHQGISNQTGVPLGTVGIITGLLVLVLWIPLGERIGIGTILNVILIGIVIDLTLLVAPSVSATWVRWTLLLLGVLLVGIGSGLYIGSGLGPGPRDGLMTGLGRKGVPISAARFGVEISVLGMGFMLGGTVGIGTVVFAFGIGPLVAFMLPALSLEPLAPHPERRRATNES
ncbi:MAG: YczE/YyaS/YitT family protein [Acidimicrobiia bacterium]